jgi:replicative DNA helicase
MIAEAVAPSFPVVEPFSIPEADWAERAVCGTVLLWPERYAEVRDRLTAADFHDYAAQTVWRAIVTTHEAGIVPDALAVKALLVKTGRFEAVTAGAYLRMVDGIPRGIDLVGRAQHVLTAARYRAIQAECWTFCKMATLMAETPDDILQHIAHRFQRLGVGTSDTLKVFEGVTTPLLEQAQQALQGVRRGLVVGFRQFDALTGGLKPRQFIILAGRPGTGKTALAVCMAWQMVRAGSVVLFVTLEMGTTEIGLRCACVRTGLNYGRAEAFVLLTEAERSRHIHAIGELERVPLAVAEDATTVAAVRQQARATVARLGSLDAIIVDYLQLMRSDAVKRGDSRVYEIGDISIELKALAREFDVPVIALAQLNRNIEHRSGDRRPQLSDLRDSGQIEQDADLVAFTHRDESAPADERELIIRKHRNGACATLLLRWEDECMRFSDR